MYMKKEDTILCARTPQTPLSPTAETERNWNGIGTELEQNWQRKGNRNPLHSISPELVGDAGDWRGSAA